MMGFDHDSSTYLSTCQRNEPYSSSLESMATTSSISAWSATSSQSSNATSPTSSASDSDSYDRAAKLSTRSWTGKHSQQRVPTAALPVDARQNPRRSSGQATRCPPTLVRQSDRKDNFVDNLVDSSTQIVEAIWPTSSVVCRNDMGSKAVLPLRTFIQETLRRSRTSYSTLQVALYYLILIKPHLPDRDFTMEQTTDERECRALQCGRRMFLAALILASKWLQDRNFSARAWSKISGLTVQEINQNELAFLLAVDWNLHITDEVFQRWTGIVLKYTPPSPPAPGASSALYVEQRSRWNKVILSLNPALDNIEGVIPMPVAKAQDFASQVSRRSLMGSRQASPARSVLRSQPCDLTPTPKSYMAPNTMEPSPASAYTPGRHAPALGLLPTPRLTPQSTGYSTPAVNAATQLLGKASAMGYAMAQASNTCIAQNLDRWPGAPVSSSPQSYLVRRSSLANSVSTASSPESMVSDTSRTSRSSSISSASSLASAPNHTVGLPARFRCAKLMNERGSLRSTIPEDDVDSGITSSPESYSGSVSKFGELALQTPLGTRERELEENDAARALQALQSSGCSANGRPVASLSRKRSHPEFLGNPLQDNVRQMLARSHTTWPETLVRPRAAPPLMVEEASPRKRVCCSSEAAAGYEAAGFSSLNGYRGPMWDAILN